MIKKDRIIKILYIGLILIFVLLIYKNPFSQRTLIPNFEPYPDTFHYINPPLSLVKGEGFGLNREGRTIIPHVSPLYSISLIPSFLVKADPRMAYYSNIVLALLSAFFFWLILKKIFANRMVIFFLLILYITNYFIYWMPSLIMAENLTLTLYLTAVYLLLLKITKLKLFLISLLAVGIYATKYSSITISVSLIILSLGRIIFNKVESVYKIKNLVFFLATVVFCFLLFGISESLSKGNNILYQLYEHIVRIYNSILQRFDNNDSIGKGGSSYVSSWFGIEYVTKNLPFYVKSLLGEPNRFLWDYTPILPKYAAIGGLIGIIVGIFIKKYKFLSISLLIFTFTSVIFISAFYSFDARYIYIVIPSLLVSLGIFLSVIESKLKEKGPLFRGLIVAFTIIYLVLSFSRIKSQISLNLKYAETPWNYIAVLKMNEYFTNDKIVNGKKPVLISALPPFLIDYYTNGNYILLPLSYEQEFRGQELREIVWGPNDYSDLPKLYTKYLNEGYKVYVSRAGLGNEGYTNRDFNTITEKFDTKLVQGGCFEQCNIYSVKLKEKNAL